MRRYGLLAVLAVFALALTSGAAVGGGSNTEISGTAERAAEFSGPLMVELTADPSVVTYAEARKRGASKGAAAEQAQGRAAANEAAQEGVLDAIAAEGIDATPLYQVQKAYNGIAVTAEPGAAEELAALPGVKAVHPIPLAEPHNGYTVPLIGSKPAWQNFGTGDGISIAVIDTGVDYVHTGFGGSGSAADYTAAQAPANNPPTAVPFMGFTVMSGATQIYPTAKIVGGWDFVGNNYNATGTPAQQIANPDPNPMDCNGHGTHVSGTAAGYGVNADQTTFAGPWNGSTDTSFDAMHIGPGVAPEAEVYALKVFGCAGSTAFTAAAIDWAMDPNGDDDLSDHVDVINMSLGSDFGTPDDPSAAASQNAAAAGVIVVASAGNAGDVYYITGSPATSTRTISVASSADEVDTGETIRVNSPGSIAGDYFGSKSVNFNWNANPSVTGNVYYPATNQYGCDPWTDATDLANISGSIVLIDWKKPGDATFPCGSTQRANNATAAGASGIIMVDNVPYSDVAIAANATTPAMVTTSAVGDTIKSELTAGVPSSVDVTLDSLTNTQAITPGRDDTLSSFTSRGPRTRGTALKPDISAPGQSIWSPAVFAGWRGRSLNGTSMASPHVAGVMALLREALPSWSVEELKALAMNTAGHDLTTGFNGTGNKYGPGRVGAGRVNVGNALTSSSIAYNADGSGAVSVSFGALEVAGAVNMERTIRVANHGPSTQTYGLSFDERLSIPGVSITIPGSKSLTVPAGDSRTFRVRLQAVASQMKNTRDVTVDGMQAGNPRHWLSEVGGLVLVTPASGPSLRVPVYGALRPASATHADETTLAIDPSTNAGTISIAGLGVNTGAEPLGYVSKVSAFELQHTSGLATLGSGVSELARNGDIQHVGVATKANTLHFGISTHGDWSTPAADVQFLVQFDTNSNTANVERTAFNTRLAGSDVFVSAIGSGAGATGAVVAAFTNVFSSNVTTAPFDNNVMVLPIPVSTLLLPAGQTSFNYRVIGQSRFWGTIETTPWMAYDHASPGLSFSDGLGGRPMYVGLAGTKIDVGYNAAAFAANGSQGALLLHHFNQKGNRTEVLPVTVTP